MKPSPDIIKNDFKLRLSLGGKVTPHIPPPPYIVSYNRMSHIHQPIWFQPCHHVDGEDASMVKYMENIK
jgi:hypothetical protein